MKRKANTSKHIQNHLPATQLIEEAFHLVRSASAKSLWYYFVGTIPFVCYLFYFWADMSRSSYAVRDSTFAAMGLAMVYFWKCSWQAMFCRSLWDMINPGYLKKQHGLWQKFRYHSALWFFHAVGLPLAFISIVTIVPAFWVLTTMQNGTALAFTRDYSRRPLRGMVKKAFGYSGFQAGQNMMVFIFLGFTGLFAWINVLAAIALPPKLLKIFFGIETAFSKNSGALMNSTFLFGTLLVVYLIMSLFLKGIYVLRCFYAESRNTGADMLSRLSQQKNSAVALVVGFVVVFGLPTLVLADEPTVDRSTQLDQAIRDTMASKKYEWKFDRVERVPKKEKVGWLVDFSQSIRDQLRELSFQIAEKIEVWIEKFFNRNKKTRKSRPARSLPFDLSQIQVNTALMIVLGVLLTGIVSWLIYLLVVKSRDLKDEDDDEAEVTIDTIDLESEDIVADLLEEDEWLVLAKRQIAQGEGRLAIRALFLATLANLGDRELLKIQKYKSNKDYRRELELRARPFQVLRQAFGDNTLLFEQAWYGLHQIGDDSIDLFMKNYETITADV